MATQKYSMVQEAEGIRAKGEAEVAAIRAKAPLRRYGEKAEATRSIIRRPWLR